MTKNELRQLHSLNIEIGTLKQRIAELETAAPLRSAPLLSDEEVKQPCIEGPCPATSAYYDRLKELIKADKEGRVVVLPCRVGSTV